jgi:hypothetical protein
MLANAPWPILRLHYLQEAPNKDPHNVQEVPNKDPHKVAPGGCKAPTEDAIPRNGELRTHLFAGL